jgi:malate dehydrogenase (oxaloacetate-decarboxylating)(NADP+)
MMPIVYTPTVGEACQQFGKLFRRARGLYVSSEDRGKVARLFANWPEPDVRVVVMTDGERILGLGDQGVGGMGIPVGKLSLYTACAGIHPRACLPLMLDVGTDNQALLDDPLYLGLRQRRLRGAAHDELVTEVMTAAQQVWPRALLQFEDFANTTAFPLLEKWRDRACTFNDDIQGTAAVALAGLYSALRLTKKPLGEQVVMFLGAGAAAVGIADLICGAMVDEGLAPDEARRRIWFVDSSGLVVASRGDLEGHKVRYAHEHAEIPTLFGAISALSPTALIGVSTAAGAFDRRVVEKMAANHERPIIFALSNPTSKSECTAEQAYGWSGGRAIFASGSPFPPVTLGDRRFVPGQGNNAYIFPGLGLGVLASEARRITDRMFAEAARTLAAQTSAADLELGRIYPPLTRIREVSREIAVRVAALAVRDGLAQVAAPDVDALMWTPAYQSYV